MIIQYKQFFPLKNFSYESMSKSIKLYQNYMELYNIMKTYIEIYNVKSCIDIFYTYIILYIFTCFYIKKFLPGYYLLFNCILANPKCDGLIMFLVYT